MYTKTVGNKFILALASTLILSACGGGGNSSRLDQLNNGNNNSSTNNSSSGNNNSSTPNTTDVQRLGYGSGSNFQAGIIGVGIGNDTLSAGGTTTLTINIVSSSGDLVTENVAVTFNSRCVAANSSILTVNGTTTTSVTTATGEATIVYTANGCVGDDRITATASYQGNSLSAQGSVNVEADTIQSISFVDASPSLISLKGTGGNESSVVRFLVKGSTGAPIKDVCVDFSLNTAVGGLMLADSKCESSDPAGSKKAKTGANGQASIIVQAGTISTPVTVTAKDQQTGLSTQSNGLRVSTGVPDQKSMSLSASVSNPSGWEYDDEEVTFTILLADAFFNPPADGTSVSFTASGGAITDNCNTTNGKCSVTWRSQDPRPINGKVTILAHTTGNESFKDENSNGWYDAGVDIFATASNANPACAWNAPPSSASRNPDACDDLAEAYLDENQDGTRSPGEFYIDFNDDGVHNAIGDGIYNGVLCRIEDVRSEANPSGTCTRSGVTIRKDYRIVMSSERPYLQGGRLVNQPISLSLATNQSVEFDVNLADINGNALPAGTVITVVTTEAESVTATPASITIPSTTTPQTMSVRLRAASSGTPSGFIYFNITGPKGLTTSTSVTSIN